MHDLHGVNPQAMEKFHRRLLRDPAFGHVLLVVRPEILIHPALALCARGHLDAGERRPEPLRLERFPEGARRILRNPFAYLGDLLQFLLSLRILFFSGQFGGEFGIAPGPGRHGVAGHDDRFEKWFLGDQILGLREGLWSYMGCRARNMHLDLSLKIRIDIPNVQ